ncbi:Uncaracterized surface protein containing fasciclin (FAS1) repeats [Methylophilus rhizosphaerae]|uniref:Uncaracterized surface protein containing fasciclin (FAS1) repeats n=1 Tax=Methylophilus rhizosphaerae TaxID=492660 RepID=A0A1G9B8R2_9PROT|nr:fasciclin domain-containing protein [Methylophilus rhizosphaerae]SDK35942.1 Uncaracterized surface protein containing fasciclin (FAS1) repeats [Methylophilus rhizosphaerae]
MNKLVALTFLALSFTNHASADTLLQTAEQDGSFKTFLKAVKVAGLESTLNGAGPMTVFAPDDAAFAKLPKARLKALMANGDELKKILSYHVYPGKITQADVAAGKVKSLEGADLQLSVSEGVKVNNVKVVGDEINADNGVIHTVSAVLIPKG